MWHSKFTILATAVIFIASIQELLSQQTRDPQKWPFADTSIWNIPIGTGARYVHAQLQEATAWGMTIDEDLIVMRPDVYLMTILESDALWDRNKSRCITNGKYHLQVPIPADFIVSPDNWDGLTPNSGLAVLMPDNVTIKQTQPFAHCNANAYATSKYSFGDVNIFGDGRRGAHGGSGLSAIGGTIRLGELAPGGEIKHVMKVNVFGKKNLYYDDVTKGYRWPAYSADAYAKNNYGTLRKPPPECRMGALLALPSWINLDTFKLETVPAKILARAFQNYGAYIVDDTGWDVYGLIIEWGPGGRVADEFESVWGFDITSNLNSPWAGDIRKIFENLHVVDNNSQDSIGGGGTPLVPAAPPFGKQGNHYPVVTITSPQSFSTIKQGITEIKANAYDVDGAIREVEFYINGILIGADSTFPYSVQFNIEKDREYLLVARATDNEYLSAVSRGFAINTYANQAPSVYITEPDSGTILDDGKPYMVKVNASDPDGEISRVELFKGWERVGAINESPFIFTIANAVIGEYHFSAIAYDDYNAYSISKEVIIKVEQLENDLPTINITYPADNAEFIDGDNITINADAFDIDGMITNVDFISNGEILKSDPRPPYNYDWNGIDEGIYKINAKVYSEGEQIVESDTITVRVKKTVGQEKTYNTKESVRIYPNPVHDECLAVEFDNEPKDTNIQIMSMDGKVALERNINSKLEVIEINNFLSKGIYLVKIRNNNKQILEKLIIL